MKVGYIGLGNMGGPLASRLQLQYQLAVFDRSDAAMQRLVGEGATGCPSASELAAQCDVILLCLPTSHQVRSVIFGADGIAAAAKPDTLIVDQTTGDPAATRAMAAELTERGLELIDAPVSGGPMGAEAGTIAIIVGSTPAQFETISPILQAISPNIFHAGEVGTGHVMKLANNMLSSVHRAVSLETLALAAKNGVNPGRALDILLASSGRNFFLETFGRSHILSGKLASGFTLALQHKDVRLACQLGIDSGVPMLFGNLAKEFYQVCINNTGAEVGVNAAALVMDRLAGTQVVPPDPTLLRALPPGPTATTMRHAMRRQHGVHRADVLGIGKPRKRVYGNT